MTARRPPPPPPRRRAALLVLAAVAACDAAADAPHLEAATPPYGPLVGGTRITLTGTGFTAGGAAPNRVLVAGREAPLTATVDDTTLEVVIPPGAQPGDAELVVLNGRGNARAAGLFRYSTPPTITGVEPASVMFDSSSTRVTVTGTGFADEGAGDVIVVVDGRWIMDVDVLGDTAVSFLAPPGRALLQPDLELVDGRGRATRPRAFRYAPSTRGGLLLFPTSGPFAVFLDPVDHSTVAIPRVGPALRFTAVVRDEHGDYWGLDRSRRYGRIDMRTQAFETPVQNGGWFPTMIRIGADLFALDRSSLRFGRFDPATGAFTALGTDTIPCCGSYGLASDGATYFTARQGGTTTIAPIDLATGALGTPVPIVAPAGLHVEEMRFFGGVLYAANRNGTIVTIDPLTGATTVLPVSLGRASAMEVYP